MIELLFHTRRDLARQPLRVLAIGAHCDDVEIGAGGTLARLASEVPGVRTQVVVLTSTPERAAEARAAAAALLAPAQVVTEVHPLKDGRLPVHWDEVKDILEEIARTAAPEVIFAPSPADAHQDHRLVGSLVHTVFRDHLVLHYEIPKWDGDLGSFGPTHYVPLTEHGARAKCALLREHFPSQHGRDWFLEETFLSLARLRGMECRSRYAEAFAVHKAVIALPSAGI